MTSREPPERPRPVRVEAIHVRVPFRRPLLDATGEYTHRRSWLLRVAGEDGRQGLGEAALNPFADETTTGALAALMREIVPALAAGREVDLVDLAGEGEAGRAATAALEGARASLPVVGPAGPLPGTPGRPPEPIPGAAAIGFGGPDAGADAAAQAVELGFGTLALRAGFERTTDQLVDRLRAIRAAIGPEPRLRVDVGGAWDLATATERLLAIEPFRVEFVAQPLAAGELAGHAALRGRTGIRIALDDDVASVGSARAALAEGAAEVLVVKPARVGGLAATLRIAEAAAASGARVVLGTYFETGVGIAAVLRVAAALRASGLGRSGVDSKVPGAPSGGEVAHHVATAGVLAHDLLSLPLPIRGGMMAVPAAVALDESEIDRYALERVEANR